MANLSDRYFLNVPGMFYNDESCIDCGLCPAMAPGIFRRDDAGGQSYVWHQPQTPEELTLAKEAAAGCPTESIGTDGESPSSGSKDEVTR
jgi:ferredoxin